MLSLTLFTAGQQSMAIITEKLLSIGKENWLLLS